MEDNGSDTPTLESPLLVYTHDASKYQTFCTISPFPPSNRFHRRSVVEMFDKVIVGSSHGWLILQSKQDITLFSLFNPVTSQSLHLPPLEAASNYVDEDVVACTLSSPPVSTDADTTKPCVLYLYFRSTDLLFFCRPTQRLSCSWVELRVRIDGISPYSLSITIFNGTLYGWAYPRYFYSAEVPAGDDLDLLTLTNLQINQPSFDLEYDCVEYHYIECSGHLYCTFVYSIVTVDIGIVGVKVSELDLAAHQWKEVNCLDGRAFFLNEIGDSTWCWGGVADPNSTTTSRGVKQNCVYLFSPLESDQTLYEYNMLDQSLTPICPCPNLEGPHDQHVWVKVSGSSNLGFDFWGCEMVDSSHDAVVKKGSDDDLTQVDKLIELPMHLIEHIAKYLHLFDYWSFRASCRMFKSAAPLTKSWRTNSEFPSFLFFKNDAGLCSLMDPFRPGSRYSSILQPCSQPFRIIFSNNDWLLTLVGTKTLRFFNPFTKEKGKYPVCEDLMFPQSFGFSTNPASDDCVTVATLRVFSALNYVSFFYIRSGDKQWSSCDFGHEEGITFKPTSNTPVFYQGSFWFLDVCGYIGALTLADGQESWSVFEKPDTRDSNKFDAPYLVEWAGKLCSVFIGEMGRGVKIFEFDNKLEKKWREVEDLGDHILFISSTFCCSRVVRDVNLRNRIYLPRLKGNSIVYYSLDTRKYHVSRREEESMNDLHHTKQPMKCCWI